MQAHNLKSVSFQPYKYKYKPNGVLKEQTKLILQVEMVVTTNPSDLNY